VQNTRSAVIYCDIELADADGNKRIYTQLHKPMNCQTIEKITMRQVLDCQSDNTEVRSYMYVCQVTDM